LRDWRRGQDPRGVVKPMRKIVVAIIACATLGVANAEERNPLEAKFIVDTGWFFVSSDTTVRVDGETTGETGTDIDYDEEFGLGDFDRFRGEVLWRFTDSGRHAIRGMYFENNRSSTRNIDRDITFGDETYPVGASVTAGSDLAVFQVSYDYAFLRRENYELAGGIGLHMLDVGLSLAATLTTQGGSVTRSAAEEASTGVPLPVLGLRGVWRPSHSFYLTGQVQYFYIEFDPYKGSLTDLKFTAVWQATDHFGVGVGYNDFGFRFDIDDERDFEGRLRWSYGGAFAFATFMF
jgi:hypothetical protein